MSNRIHAAAFAVAIAYLAPLADTWGPTSDAKAIVPGTTTTNIGIGIQNTSVVGARFQVVGGTSTVGAGLPIILEAQKGAANFPGGNITITSGQNGATNLNGNILFAIGGTVGTAGTVSNERMRVDQTGRVGIGIQAPLVALDVTGPHVENQGVIRASSPTHSLIVANSGTTGSESGFRLSEANVIKWDIAQNEGGSGNNLTFSDGGKSWVKILRSNGYFGIGNALNPLVQLDISGTHVNGQGLVRATSTDHAYFVANSGNPANGAYESGFRLSANNVVKWDIGQNVASNGHALTFNNATGPVIKVLQGAGYVGIGAAITPAVQLDVSGTHVNNLGIIRASSASHALIVASAATGGFLSGFRLSEANVVKWDIAQNDGNPGGLDANSLTFNDGVVRVFRIQRGTGNVGIGADVKPIVKLDVMGSHVDGYGIIRANSVNHALIVANAASASFESGFRLSNANQVMWDIAQNENINGNNLTFSSSTKQCMTISQATGNVGIGTGPTAFKLDVSGHANISGDLTVASVNTRKWSISPPDYVFDEDYKLASLDTVHAYIRKNKHLPEIPSAREMNANGMNLAEMNLRLLKKVEELTLYMIDQKQDLSRQAGEIAELKTKSKQLEKLAGLRR